MHLAQWLDAEKGRLASLAAHFNVSVSAVSQWRSNGVPVKNMKAVRDFTEGHVTLEEMVPAPSPSREAGNTTAGERGAAEVAAR